MNRVVFFLFFIFSFVSLHGASNWVGDWIAYDEWQSEFKISILEGGKALSNYGDGEEGEWEIKNGNVEIIWDSSQTDYIFNGVMGIQRIRKKKNKSYSSGMRKLLD